MICQDDCRVTWKKFIEGDRNAILTLYDQHYLGMINYGKKFRDDRRFVNDCYMDMLIEFWEKREKLPQVDNVRSYLMTSLRRKILAELRAEKKTKREIKRLQAWPAIEHSYEEYILNFESDLALKNRIERTLNKLSSRQKELVVLKFFHNLSYNEIAIKCEITKRTAYNIIQDSVKILREELESCVNASFLLGSSFLIFFSL